MASPPKRHPRKRSLKLASVRSTCAGFACPVLGSVQLLEKKWALRVLDALGNSVAGVKGVSFNELKRRLGGITQSVLSQRLKELQAAGFVKRREQMQRGVRVALYSLDREAARLVSCWRERDAPTASRH